MYRYLFFFFFSFSFSVASLSGLLAEGGAFPITEVFMFIRYLDAANDILRQRRTLSPGADSVGSGRIAKTEEGSLHG